MPDGSRAIHVTSKGMGEALWLKLDDHEKRLTRLETMLAFVAAEIPVGIAVFMLLQAYF